MEKEIAGIDSRKTWQPVHLKDLSKSQREKIVQAIGLIAEKHKLNANDVLDLVLKGRLCADGRREDVTIFAEGDVRLRHFLYFQCLQWLVQKICI
jgi:hypothetical protein